MCRAGHIARDRHHVVPYTSEGTRVIQMSLRQWPVFRGFRRHNGEVYSKAPATEPLSTESRLRREALPRRSGALSIPLRYQFAIALVGLNMAGIAALGMFAYRASRRTLEQQATQNVAVVAQEREHALTQLLQRRQERMEAFLRNVESLCGERTGRGSYGWERECVRVALNGFRS